MLTNNSADEATVIENLLHGECMRPVQVIAFNIAEGNCPELGTFRGTPIARTSLARRPLKH